MIKTPTNFKLLTNVAVVRIKKTGKRFEIACYKNKVLNWRNGSEKNLDEVLQIEEVYSNASKGEKAKREDLVKAFGTDNRLEICKIILEKGDMQVSDKERQVTTDSAFKEIASMVSSMTINSETKRPYPTTVIEKALKDAGFSVKPTHTPKQQALDAINKLKETMTIDRAKMRVRVAIGHHEAKKIHDTLKKLFEKVEVEDWEEGNLEMVGLIAPGNYKQLVEVSKTNKKNPGEVELLSLKVVDQEEIEIK